MAQYEVFLKESVWRDVNMIPRTDIWKILAKIEKLADDPRLAGCEKLTEQEFYRVRQGRYRIAYSIHDNELTVWIIKIGHRKDVYR